MRFGAPLGAAAVVALIIVLSTPHRDGGGLETVFILSLKGGSVAVNGTCPGPLLRIGPGEWATIRVVNQLNVEATIHWHGISQRGTPESDGVAWVTQKPIEPGCEFIYRFQAPAEAGTYWYHGHMGTLRVDGLYGALLVMPVLDPTPPVWMLADAFKFQYDLYPSTRVDEPEPSAILVNNEVLSLSATGIVRVINAAEMSSFTIEGALTVFELDSVSVEPFETTNVTLVAGQRASIMGMGKVNINTQAGMFPVVRSWAGTLSFDKTEFGRVTKVPAMENATVHVVWEIDGNSVNGYPFEQPTALADYSEQNTFGSGAVPFVVPVGSIVEVEVRNTDEGSHGFHIHGFRLLVVSTSPGGEPVGTYRDVVAIPPLGNVTVRFDANQPGVWISHCHIDWHMRNGLAALFVVKSFPYS